ncbi:hypothetical protein ACFC3O_28860 [Streptomyces sp. NPDC056007]|uniref:hypothetical protein n=1 Tax=Streptomyces sp. NPDC056007 TaxID=3345678 RepID=UPI0035E0CD60
MTPTTAPTTAPLWEHTLPATPTSAPPADHIADTARDAASRARALLDHTPHDPDPLIDLVRLLHGRPSSEAETAAARAGLRTAHLRRLRTAYTLAGTPAVRVSLYLHTPDPTLLTTATHAIQRLRRTAAALLAIDHNRITDPDAHVQIRLGQDGLAYPFTAVQDDWVLAGRPTPSPGDAYTAARHTLRNRRG